METESPGTTTDLSSCQGSGISETPELATSPTKESRTMPISKQSNQSLDLSTTLKKMETLSEILKSSKVTQTCSASHMSFAGPKGYSNKMIGAVISKCYAIIGDLEEVLELTNLPTIHDLSTSRQLDLDGRTERCAEGDSSACRYLGVRTANGFDNTPRFYDLTTPKRKRN